MLIFVATALATALIASYVYLKTIAFRYWQRRGIGQQPPSFPFGNLKPVMLQQASMGEYMAQVYANNDGERLVGLYAFGRPLLVVRDPALIRDIFIKDFAHFHDRGIYVDEQNDPLSSHLFALSGARWKHLRTKLTPVFTSGKLKAMFATLLTCGESLQRHIAQTVADDRNEFMEMREISARFTTDVIASVAFGVQINTIDNPETDFRRYGRRFFEMTWKNGLRFFVMFLMPNVQKLLGIKIMDADVEQFFLRMVQQTMDYRMENNVMRKDMFQLLLQLRNGGDALQDDDWEMKNRTNDSTTKQLTFNEMAAQAFVFYVAGFETSSSTMSFCLFELAKNQSCQRRVQAEIDEVNRKYQNEINYESMGELKYLEACIDETLRKYPIAPILNRECTIDYKVPGTNEIVIERGTAVLIPSLGLQRDAKYYPEPNEFRPERFYNQTAKAFVEQPYMPFGDGPRNCIGMRLGKMQVKIGLMMILQKNAYHLLAGAKSELDISPKHIVMCSSDGVKLKVTSRQ